MLRQPFGKRLLQVFVQVLASAIDTGAVRHPFPIAGAEGFQRPPPGFVVVKVTVYPPIAVQIPERLRRVGHRVEHEVVFPVPYTQRTGGQVVHEALMHVADGRAGRQQGDILRRHTPLEERVAYLISAASVAESNGKIPLAVHGIANLLTVCYGDGGRYATLLQIMEQSPVLQGKYLHILKALPASLSHSGTLTRLMFRKRHTRHLRHILHLRKEVVRPDELPGKCEDVSALAFAKIIPEIFLRVHLERRCLFLPVRRPVPYGIGTPLHGMMPQPCKEVLYRHFLHSVYFRFHRLTRQLMMNFIPIPYSVRHTPVLPPQRKRSRSVAVSAIKSARYTSMSSVAAQP